MTILEFLKAVSDKGPWSLSWGKFPQHHGFFETPEAALVQLHAAQSRQENTWFRINTATAATGTNGSVTDPDITHYNGIPIDIDAPPMYLELASLDKWKEDVVTMLCSGTVPQPSLIWTSGNGIQALYSFTRPQTPEECPKYSAIVKHVAEYLQKASWPADGKIFNPSRLLRIPWGCNFKRKIDGSYPEAKILHWFPIKYEPTDKFFAMATDMPTVKVTSPDRTPDREIGAGVLPPLLKAPPILRRLMVNGADGLDHPQYGGQYATIVQRFNDESAGEQWIASHLQAAGNSDEIIREAMMTQGTWCERNLTNKKNPQRELERHLAPGVLERYYPFLTQIRDMNRKYKFIANLGGKPCVVGFTDVMQDVWGRGAFLEAMSKDIRENWQLGEDKQWVNKPADKPKLLAREWIDHDLTPRYARMCRSSGKYDPEELNVWPGWALEPVPGDWSLLKQHILTNMCSGNQEHYDWLIKWLAFGVQNDGPMNSAIVLHGIEGSGKNTFSDAYKSLWKQSAPDVLNPSEVMGDFNSILAETNVLVLNEAMFHGDAKQANFLKGLITAPTLNINQKFLKHYPIVNSLRIFVMSNEDHVIRADASARRFFVLKTAPVVCTQSQHDAIVKQLDSGGRAGMLYELQNMKLGSFHPSAVPITDALRAQQEQTESAKMERMHSFDSRIYSWLCEGHVPTAAPEGDGADIRGPIISRYLQLNWKIQASEKTIASRFQKLCGATTQRNMRGRWQHLPSLKECRTMFAKIYPLSAKDWADDPDGVWCFDSTHSWRDEQQEFESN